MRTRSSTHFAKHNLDGTFQERERKNERKAKASKVGL
jgi:hypothetical protein